MQKDNDFSVRAVKTTQDELGQLTDAFNTMLSGIQARDSELEDYRQDLENKVDVRTRELRERNQAMRLVLDNVDQGLATIKRDGSLSRERSAVFDKWFGQPANDDHFATHLAKDDGSNRDLLEVGWDEVVSGFFPLKLTLGQMPRRLRTNGRHYTLDYKAINNDQGEDFAGALLVVTDITEEEEARRREALRSEQLAIFGHLTNDRLGFIQFFRDSEALVESLFDPTQSPSDVRRSVHTLKGNCSVFSITSVAAVCHQVEDQIQENPTEADVYLPRVGKSWKEFARRARPLMVGSDSAILLEKEELSELLDAVRKQHPYPKLEQALERLQYEPVSARFHRVGEQAKRIASQLGKPEPQISAFSSGLRLPTSEWAPFWNAFIHVIRNAIDHGLEPEQARLSAGKSGPGCLELSAFSADGEVRIEVTDDGRGIGWDKVREKAKAAGLPAATQEDLEKAILSDSFSTKDQATEVSGRGVGLSAVAEAVREMGGYIDIHSEPGAGTKFSFVFPTTPHKRKQARAS